MLHTMEEPFYYGKRLGSAEPALTGDALDPRSQVVPKKLFLSPPFSV
jgi:hypothetical protein